jgi:hypothetical protein
MKAKFPFRSLCLGILLGAMTAISGCFAIPITVHDEGANPSLPVVGVEQLPGKSNYFIGNDPKQWRVGIAHYAKVKYEGVYPGIDLIYYGNQGQVEYDFVVAPGADPGAIKLAFEGMERLRVDAEGNLIVHATGGEVIQHAPAIDQEINSVKQIIPGHYVLQGKGQVGFRVAAYDRSRPLVIDPVLIYSTFLGGSSFEEGFGIAVDAAGSAYITGLTNSADFPTVNAFQASFAGPTFPVAQCQDVAVSTDLGLCSSNASVDAGSSDPNGGTVTLSQAPPGPYLLGDTDVTLAVTNGQGLSASCLATVTALDQEPPIIECPTPQVECTGPAGTTATFNPTVTDNCPGSTASCTPSSGSAFPLAITPGSCTATDSTLNASTCDFTVTVVDTTAPTVTAALVPVRVNPRKQIGRFRVEFSCSDICDASALPSAELNGIAVANGQDIKLKVSDKTKVELNEAGNLVKLEAPTFSLVATCADASASVGIATATPDFGP